MTESRRFLGRTVVIAAALFALAWVPGFGLAQQGQGGGGQGGSQAQKQGEKAQADKAAQAKKAQGVRKAPPANASGRQQAAPQKAQPQVPATIRRGAPSQQPGVTAGVAQRPQAGGANRNPYGLFQPTAKSAPQPPAAQGGGIPTVVRPQRPSRALAGMPPAVNTPPAGPISREALTRKIPPAPFRGPQVERRIVAITPQVHQRGMQQITSWVREQNSRPTEPGGRPTHDWIGNPIPADARLLGPSFFTQINTNYRRIANVFGQPRHDYVVLPRTTFYAGFFDQGDGFFGFQHYGHRSAVSITLFYPYYFSQPSWYAFNYPGFYPSVYSMYGWCPGWIYPDRVYYQPNAYVYAPAPYRPGIRLDVAGLERAISDIRQAWLDDDPTLFSAHLTDQLDIRVYFNGKYSYTSSANDYFAMTADAMSTTQSTRVDFGDPVWISGTEVFCAGRQAFSDPDGTQRDLYISYRLRKLGSDWYIVAFGSSPDPIESQYTDFRNR